MNTTEQIASVAAITEAAQSLVQDEPRNQPSLRLGPRLSGTTTFGAPEGSTEGVVVLRPVDATRTDWYVAEVLPGGTLVKVLIKFEDGVWSSPGSLRRAAGADVLPLLGPADDIERLRGFVAFTLATSKNLEQVASIRHRAATVDSVFAPCLAIYDAWVGSHPEKSRLSDLTEHLLGASEVTRGVIRTRSASRHEDPEAALRSVVNSLKRSAGTNYQGLVALAISEELLSRKSLWYVEHPPPRSYMKAMAIRFTGIEDYAVDIDPDIDVLLRNAAWSSEVSKNEPVVMLSVKTSLADRAGAAARWKMYFDIATRTCRFANDLAECAWHQQGVRFASPDVAIDLKHCIVTANIYKVNSDKKFAKVGELGTAQTKANTFMFDRRFATRVGDQVEMTGWQPLTELITLLAELSAAKNIPS